ncbi:Phosphoglucomutase-3 [Phytophthora pseudosyringae]|uniref:Phosphoglucomutase-3 n=1 Tax=Phytophthora pseudosyringae TaxID=221518 RepID=A0A8T1VNU8_9STRA|nr:Phosphoglucomutase-3 [Phytophthora pseudosyringae]
MRDVSARFKYSEREFHKAASLSGSGSSSSSSDDSENKPPPAAANAAHTADDDAAQQPDACPSRELIHSHIRRYYRDVDAAAKAATDWEAVSARIRRDLAPYTVLKLGGFSLGDACTRLLGDVLAHGASKLRTLDLGFNRLTDKGASQLAEALEANASLESLYLSGNEIGPAGARALAQALTKNTHLRSLHLSGNNIGEEGARFLADGIAGNTALRSLYLGTNGIGAAGMQSLATALTHNTSLEELTLGQNKVGSAGVRHLAAAFATGHVALSTLELGKNGVDQEGAIALARSLCGVNRLQNLYMDHNPLGDVGASAFGALLTQNTELRVLDLSYTHMSLLGLRELSVVGLARSRALLCLLVDGHDWASTQYMKKNQHPSLNGASLATKGANNYAASCIVGAINANVHSVLFKLTGVDLSLVVAVPDPSSSNDGGRESDALSRNELVLKGLHDARVAAQASAVAAGIPPSHKRKPTEDASSPAADRMIAGGADSGADSDVGESASPVVQHPKFQKLEGNLKAGSSSGSIGSANGGGSGGGSRSGSANALLGLLPPPHNGPGNGASSSAGGSGGSSPSKTSSNRPPRVIRIPSRGSMGRFPRSGGSCEKRLSLKSPRYESTMEVHVRKVISDIAKLPFNADEYDTLQAYYLGGRCSTGSNGCSDWGVDDVTGEPTPCPACRSSRLARYRRTMALKTRLEASKQVTDAALLVLLRQLHYLVGAFQNVENAVQTIDGILVSAHDGMDEPHQFSSVPLPSQKAASQHTQ